MDQKVYIHFRSVLFLCCSLLLIVAGCEFKKDVEKQPVLKHGKTLHKENIPPSLLDVEVQAPMVMRKGQFNKINGWLDNETIIYMENVEFGTNIYAYHLFSGKSSLIFESEDPVSTVLISPSRRYLLIQSSPNSHEGIISIIDTKGKLIMNERVNAFEFTFEWNPYDENKLSITAFAENWDYNIYLLNLVKKTVSQISNKEPFISWISDNEYIYLNWGGENASLFVPLVKKTINHASEEVVLNDVYFVKAIKDIFMTVTVKPEKAEQAVYTFYSSDLKKLSSFSVPHLTRYSDWLVPYFDFDEKQRLFTFQPLFSTEADEYKQEFLLVSYDIHGEKHNIVMENLNNEPLSCAPNGSKCLFGFYFEKLIDVEAKKIIPLVKDF